MDSKALTDARLDELLEVLLCPSPKWLSWVDRNSIRSLVEELKRSRAREKTLAQPLITRLLVPNQVAAPITDAKRTCNRHNDCDEANAKWLAAHPGSERWNIPANFHCHDDDCEDCFGQ